MSSPDTKSTKPSPIPLPEDEPPPYSEPSHYSTPSRTDADLSLIVTIKLHRPSRLENERGGRISRSGPERSSFSDAVLCPPPRTAPSWSTFNEFFERIQIRAAERLESHAPGTLENGSLVFQPLSRLSGGGKVNVNVDAGNWEAVVALLAQERGELVFEVVDVPRGWMVVESKGKGSSRSSRK